MSNRSSGSGNRKSKELMELHSEIDEQIEILKNEISKTGIGSSFPKDQSNESFVEKLYQEGLIQEDVVRDLKEAMEKVLNDNEHGLESEEEESTNQNHTDFSNHDTKNTSSICTEFSDKYLQMTAGKRTLSSNDDNPISYSSETQSNRVSSCFDISCASTTDDKTNELEKQLSQLQSMCDALATENLKIKSNHKIVKEKQLKNLKRRNGELADIAEKMSQKARELYEKNVKKAQDITSLRASLRKKKHDFEKYQMRRKSEHEQAVENLHQQLQVANSQIEDLKSKVEQTRKLKLAEMGIETKTYEDEDVDLIRKKERLRLEKLVATSSNKIVVRSLSTPTTARQKILEEANRTLRRQLTDREVQIQEIEKEISRVQQVEVELLQKSDQQRGQLSQELEQANSKVSNLESHLKTSTVAASDFDLQLTELRVVHAELQNDYNIVHDQLKLSIHERDQACERWIETSNEVEAMSVIIEEMKKEAKTFQIKEDEIDLIHNKPNPHTQKEEIFAPEYQQTLKLLQEKVNNLEEYCKKQENENTRLRSQLLALTNTNDSSEKDFPNTNGKSEICDEVSSLDQEMTDLVEAFSMKENYKVSNHVAVMGSFVGEGNQMNGGQEQGDSSCRTSQHSPPQKVKRFVAKFSYDPLMGPNDNPEAELSLKAGDYVFVQGSMDDDGFYEGKLEDGSKGLVPSNYLEEIVPTCSNTLYDNSSSHLHGRSNSYDLTAEVMMGLLPFPRHLVVEKTLSHSLIIGWTCPLFNDRNDTVDEYHIHVNGSLSAVINGSKSKAVVENIYHDEKSYRIALCAVTARGRSNPENCVITVGKDAYNCKLHEFRKLVEFEAVVVTARSVTVAWKPINSYSTYEIFLEKIDESVSASTSKEGGEVAAADVTRVEVAAYMTRHIIHHLKPDTKYRINISPKTNHRSNQAYESAPLEFTTLSDNALEAPTIVKVDESNKSLQSNHVTLSWLPNHKIGCNSEQDQISSYLVFVNQENAAFVSSPSVHRCKINFSEISACVAHHLVQQRQTATQVTSKQQEAACSSPFTTLLSYVSISMQSVSKTGAKSPVSQSYFLHKNTVRAIKAQHQKTAATDDDGDDDDDDGDKVNDQQRLDVQQVVPAIEITQGTSSENSSGDDDPHRNFRLESADEMASASKGSRTSTIRRKSSGCSGASASTSRQRFVRRNYSEDDSSSSHASVTMSPRLGMNQHQSSKLRSSSLSNFHGWVEEERKQRHHVKRSSSQHHHRRKSNGVHHHMRRKRPISPRHNSMLHFSDRSDGSDSSWYSSSPTLDHCFQKTLPGKNPEMRLSPVNNDFCSPAGNTVQNNKGLVVAIYHYDPYTMSPNADYLDEELPFESGEPLVVFGTPGADGFYYGVKQNGKKGYIPSNMVSSVKVGEEDEIMSNFFKRSADEVCSFFHKHEGSRSFTSDPEGRGVGKRNDKSSDISLLDTMLQETTEERKQQEVDKMKKGTVADDQMSLTENGKPLNYPRYFVALYDYDPNTSSPNIDIEVELSFRENDVIKVQGSLDVDGFYQGELNNRSGLVPCNFVQEIDDPEGHVVNLKTEKQEQKNDNSSTISLEADDRDTSKLSKHPPKSRPVVKQGPKNSKNVYKKTTIRQPPVTVLHEPSVKRMSLLSKGKKLFRKLGETKSKK